jgi:predicted nucleic acid-binding protein
MEQPVTAVYDANILYPAPLRDLFIRLAQAGLVRARWTEAIHEEWSRNVLKDNPRLSAERLARTRTLMNEAVRDCLVTGYEDLIPSLSLPDPDDRHVLAAAIRASADLIVTYNLTDFPAATLARFDIEALHPDDFLVGLLDLAPGVVCAAVKRVCKTRPRQHRNSSPRWKARVLPKRSPASASSRTSSDPKAQQFQTEWES